MNYELGKYNVIQIFKFKKYNFAGAVSVSKSSINYVLSSEKKGNVLCIVVGGAQESLMGRPGMARLCLKNRKGFCKMALISG